MKQTVAITDKSQQEENHEIQHTILNARQNFNDLLLIKPWKNVTFWYILKIWCKAESVNMRQTLAITNKSQQEENHEIQHRILNAQQNFKDLLLITPRKMKLFDTFSNFCCRWASVNIKQTLAITDKSPKEENHEIQHTISNARQNFNDLLLIKPWNAQLFDTFWKSAANQARWTLSKH